MPGPDTLNYIHDLLNDLVNTTQAVSKVLLKQLTPSFGPTGVPGDAEKIKAACDNLYALFLTLFEWELDVRFVRPHEAFAELFSKMSGWTTEMRSELRRLTIEFDTLVSSPGLSGSYTLTMTINAPTGLQAFEDEFHRMANDPKVLAAISSKL
ncbi:MAG: hypothetical protein IPN42_09960 [Methylococcaceae bacterium]|nr:hypothetical protein [Methylococcaceae bacterium]